MATKLQSKAGSQSNDEMFGSTYGDQSDKQPYVKYSSYDEELPYLINRTVILPSKVKQMKQSARRTLSDSRDLSGVSKHSESSNTHRDFLQKALKSIEVDL